ncbi:MAG TPA: glycosyltransferase [Vicinamibacterales bacterium]|nr:glycosyltransferase [Vicinamibacterales bacterium]
MKSAAPVRVLHVCAGNLYGGVERIVAECAADRALCPGMSASFAVCFEGRLAEEIDETGASCARLGDAAMSRPWTILRARRRLASLLRGGPPSMVICHSSWVFGIAAPVVRKAGGGLVLWLHNRVSGVSWPERWAGRTRPDLIIANSRFTGESVTALYPGAKHAVLYAPVRAGGVDGDRARVRASLGADDQTPVILVASRFETGKGHRSLIDAVAQIAEPWQLWIAGEAQRAEEAAYVRDVRDLAQASGVGDRVRFLGERRDVEACMRAADIHCQANTSPESFGLTFVEALYAGLPIVTTAIGGALEILNDACGVLVPAGDVPALRGALRRLIVDPEARQRLGDSGPSRARELCDPSRQLAALAALVGAIHTGEVAA